jgi:hypothetical protein
MAQPHAAADALELAALAVDFSVSPARLADGGSGW